MSAASHEDGYDRRPAVRWAGLTALLLFAACGGERRESPGAGTEGAAVADSAPTMPADTGGSATASSPPAAPAPDSATSQQAQRPAAPAVPAKPATPAESAAPKPKPAPETAAAPKPKPAPTTAAAPKDTASSRAPAPAAQGETGGTSQSAAADAPLRDEYHQAPRDTVDQATYDGWKQYNLNCARCHGEDVAGTTIAPHLIMSLKPDGPINTQEAFIQVVCAGRPEKGMPSWCALGMDPAKIKEMYLYVKGRSEGKLHPGRPARKEG
jgi:hypothetical protein